MNRLAAIQLLLLLSACGGSVPTNPTPEPTPGPSAPPVVNLGPFNPPLRVSGNKILDATGQPARLMGLHGCCVDGAWPLGVRSLLGRPLLERGRASGFNIAHVRIGPDMWNFGDRFNVYLRVGNRVDLDHWDPDYWQTLEATIQEHRDHGFYIEIDVVDGWLLKNANYGDHPWNRNNNVQGFDAGGEELLGADALPGYVYTYIRKVVEVAGPYNHVLFQISNEPYVPGTLRPKFEKMVADVIRRAPGYGGQLIGSNAHMDAPWADYESFHQHSPAPVKSRPTRVNEYNPELPPDVWASNYRSARIAGTDFDLWLSGASEEDIAKYMQYGRQLREEGY